MSKRKVFFVCRGCGASFPRPERKKLFCSVKCQFFCSVQKTDSCWIWKAGGHKFGYGEFRSQGKHYRAHRYSYELHNGEVPEGKAVLHKCDNPKCVNPSHLYIGTQIENGRDMSIRNRVSGRKLTESDVIDINNRLSNKESCASIARMYAVSETCIGHIKLSKNWRHLNSSPSC